MPNNHLRTTNEKVDSDHEEKKRGCWCWLWFNSCERARTCSLLKLLQEPPNPPPSLAAPVPAPGGRRDAWRFTTLSTGDGAADGAELILLAAPLAAAANRTCSSRDSVQELEGADTDGCEWVCVCECACDTWEGGGRGPCLFIWFTRLIMRRSSCLSILFSRLRSSFCLLRNATDISRFCWSFFLRSRLRRADLRLASIRSIFFSACDRGWICCSPGFKDVGVVVPGSSLQFWSEHSESEIDVWSLCSIACCFVKRRVRLLNLLLYLLV